MAMDPLGQETPLPIRGTVFPLGFPVEITTNSQDVMDEAYRTWSASPRLFDSAPLCIRISVSSERAVEPPGPPVYRAQGRLLAIMADQENGAVCDLRGNLGCAWLSSDAARDRSYLRYFFLEGMVYACLTNLHLTAIHASCVAGGESGILLCGASGAGKSCLAYACSRAGFRFVADDSPSLLRRSRERTVLGKPTFLRLRDSAASLIPELRGLPATIAPNGKPTIELYTAGSQDIRTAFQCRADYVVFLNRSDVGPAYLVPVGREDARSRIEQDIALLERWSYDEQLASLDSLLEAECLELRYRDLGSGVAALKSLVS